MYNCFYILLTPHFWVANSLNNLRILGILLFLLFEARGESMESLTVQDRFLCHRMSSEVSGVNWKTSPRTFCIEHLSSVPALYLKGGDYGTETIISLFGGIGQMSGIFCLLSATTSLPVAANDFWSPSNCISVFGRVFCLFLEFGGFFNPDLLFFFFWEPVVFLHEKYPVFSLPSPM